MSSYILCYDLKINPHILLRNFQYFQYFVNNRITNVNCQCSAECTINFNILSNVNLCKFVNFHIYKVKVMTDDTFCYIIIELDDEAIIIDLSNQIFFYESQAIIHEPSYYS